MSELVIRKIADHFARQWGGGGFMGWVIRDPRIIRWGGRGGFLDPRGSVIRGPPTTLGHLKNTFFWILSKGNFGTSYR